MSENEFEKALQMKVQAYAAPAVEGAIQAMHFALVHTLQELVRAGSLPDAAIETIVSRMESGAAELERRSEGEGSETAKQIARMTLILRHSFSIGGGSKN
ncbi:hypothetical protein [Rhodospirillum centenum]|nr:hypothetical protein [Rhodospirillum centenum]